MAIVVKAYNEGLEGLNRKRVDWLNDSIRATLHTALTFDATDSLWASVSATEITDTDYTADGVAILNPSISSASNITTLDCDNLDFTNAGALSASSIVIRDTTFAGDLLLFHIDLDGTQTSTASGRWHYDIDPTNGLARFGDTI